MCDMTHKYVCHDSFICVQLIIYMCAITYLYGWHDSFIWVTRLIYIVPWLNESPQQCFVGSHLHLYTPRCVHMWVTWLINMCAMTHLYVCICVQSLIYTGDTTHLYCAMTQWKSAAVLRWQSYTLVYTWMRSYVSDLTHKYVCHDSFICVHTCAITHLYGWHDSFILCHDSMKACSSASLAVIYTCIHLDSFICEWPDS